MSTNGEMEKKHRANYVIQWKTPASQPEAGRETAQQAVQSEAHRYSRAYRDPTADAAIGNIMREERMKKKQKDKKCRRNSTYQKERNRRRAEAWRTAKAREAEARAAKAQQSEAHQKSTAHPVIQGGDRRVEK